MTNLKGKRALVTGASRGAGREISLALAKLGCDLILHSRSLSNSSPVADEARTFGVNVTEVEAELSNAGEVDRMVGTVGRVDVLYNNAAVGSRNHEDPWSTPIEEYLRVFEVNTFSLLRICNGIASGMIERRFGRIVNVTSGIRNQPNLMPYALSKAAVDKFVMDFASALEGTGVTMNLLDPGWLRTDLGGPNAPGDVASVVPGALVPALLDNGESGRWFSAMDYSGMTLEDAVVKGLLVPRYGR